MIRQSKVLLFAVLIVAALFGGVTASSACWVTMLQECFERPENQWPWFNPAGSGRRWINCVVINGTSICYPSIPPQYLRWGAQEDYFNNAICPPEHDSQSCWVIGQLRTQDPEFDTYPPNLDTYMTFGPFSPQNFTAGHVTFFLLNRSELDHDSVYWGASDSVILTPQNMQVAGSHSGDPSLEEYWVVEYNLSDLRNYTTGDSVNIMDSTQIWLFWRFKADNNANPLYYGAFVDEVVVRFDDGCLDVSTAQMDIYRENGRLLVTDPEIGDTLHAILDLTTCDGAIDETYPAFSVIGMLGQDTMIYQRIQGADRNQRFIFTSESWIVEDYGEFTFRAVVDTLSEVTECNENNNAENETYHVNPPNFPPQFSWLAPGTDTLFISTIGFLRWTCADPEETAFVSIYYDLDQFGCEGIGVPGGIFREEHDGPDSLSWDLSNDPEGRVYFVFARIQDAANDSCIYATLPVVKRTLGADDPHALFPREFYLAQNFPNPFNPATEIRYGIAQGGHVTLRVFDLMGRVLTTLVDRVITPGHYRESFDGHLLSSGLYFYTLTTPEGTRTQKMMLLR